MSYIGEFSELFLKTQDFPTSHKNAGKHQSLNKNKEMKIADSVY